MEVEGSCCGEKAGKKLRGTPPKTNEFVPYKGTNFQVGNTSSNHGFSGDMLVFRGVKVAEATLVAVKNPGSLGQEAQ